MPNATRARLFHALQRGAELVIDVPRKVATLHGDLKNRGIVDYHEAMKWAKKLWRLRKRYEDYDGEKRSGARLPSTDLTKIIVNTKDGIRLPLARLIRQEDIPYDVFHTSD